MLKVILAVLMVVGLAGSVGAQSGGGGGPPLPWYAKTNKYELWTSAWHAYNATGNAYQHVYGPWQDICSQFKFSGTYTFDNTCSDYRVVYYVTYDATAITGTVSLSGAPSSGTWTTGALSNVNGRPRDFTCWIEGWYGGAWQVFGGTENYELYYDY